MNKRAMALKTCGDKDKNLTDYMFFHNIPPRTTLTSGTNLNVNSTLLSPNFLSLDLCGLVHTLACMALPQVKR